ncbi:MULTISPECIES: hypothetical protein [Bacillus]|uniref:hypothetical protein n=1 Tax=Bacillus TaxID=1386 RepID=UPI0035A82CA0
MKVARTVLSGGKDGDNFKVLPIATNRKRGITMGQGNRWSLSIYQMKCIKERAWRL